MAIEGTRREWGGAPYDDMDESTCDKCGSHCTFDMVDDNESDNFLLCYDCRDEGLKVCERCERVQQCDEWTMCESCRHDSLAELAYDLAGGVQ